VACHLVGLCSRPEISLKPPVLQQLLDAMHHTQVRHNHSHKLFVFACGELGKQCNLASNASESFQLAIQCAIAGWPHCFYTYDRPTASEVTAIQLLQQWRGNISKEAKTREMQARYSIW